MRRNKIVALAMAVAVVGTSLAGCGKPEETTAPTTVAGDESKAEEVASTETPKTDGAVQELSVTTWDNASNTQFSAVIEAYEAKNPNVKIKVIDTSADEYNNSLGITLSAAAADPDVIWVKDMGTLLQMSDKEQLLPVDDFITKDGVDLSVYKGAAEQLKYNDKFYALPYRSDWYVLYYNKDLFDAAGVEYPSNDMTWEQYYDLAGKVTSGEGSGKVYGTHNHTWQALVTNWGVQDGANTVVEKDYTYLKPWYEAAVKLQDDGIIQEYANLKTANIHYSSVFKNEQSAMMPMGTWFVNTLMKAQNDGEMDFNWGIATIPHPEGVPAGATVGAITPLAISAYTDQADLAWDFVKYATSEEAAEILAKEGVFTCIQTEESMNLIAFAENFPEGESSVEALNYTNFVFDRPLDPKIEEIRKVLDEVHEMIMIKSYSVDDGIAELNKRVGEIKGW